jgi:hypothetical protein
MSDGLRYKILYSDTPEKLEKKINDLKGYRAINIGMLVGLMSALMEKEEEQPDGSFSQHQVRM